MNFGVLETIYLKFRKTIAQRVTVVKLGVYNGGGNCFCGVKVKVGTDTAESTDVMIALFRHCRHLIRKGKDVRQMKPRLRAD